MDPTSLAVVILAGAITLFGTIISFGIKNRQFFRDETESSMGVLVQAREAETQRANRAEKALIECKDKVREIKALYARQERT